MAQASLVGMILGLGANAVHVATVRCEATPCDPYDFACATRSCTPWGPIAGMFFGGFAWIVGSMMTAPLAHRQLVPGVLTWLRREAGDRPARAGAPQPSADPAAVLAHLAVLLHLNTLLHAAIDRIDTDPHAYRDIAALARLGVPLDYPVEPSGATPLTRAMGRLDARLTLLLLRSGATPRMQHLLAALHRESPELLEAVRAAAEPALIAEVAPLVTASLLAGVVEAGNVPLARAILRCVPPARAAALINSTSVSKPVSLMHVAVAAGDADMLRLLRATGGSLETPDCVDGTTPAALLEHNPGLAAALDATPGPAARIEEVA
jgi:hypothetical protein